MIAKAQARRSSSGRKYKRPDNVPWDAAEIARCMALFEDDYSPEDIAVHLGRSMTSTEAKIRHQLAIRRSEEGVTTARKISPRQEDERERRREGNNARDMTAAFFGDPPRGFSALDKQRSQ